MLRAETSQISICAKNNGQNSIAEAGRERAWAGRYKNALPCWRRATVDHSVGPPRGLKNLRQVSFARLCMNLMSSVCPLQCPTHKDAGNFPFIVLWTSSECSAKSSYFGAKDPSSNRAGINRWIAGRANHSASVSKYSQYCSSCWRQCVSLSS